jgi:hypothetical protein
LSKCSSISISRSNLLSKTDLENFQGFITVCKFLSLDNFTVFIGDNIMRKRSRGEEEDDSEEEEDSEDDKEQ